MVRIMTPKGVLREITKAVPACELRMNFNGYNRRLVEAANGLDAEPTAIVMKYNKQSDRGLNMTNEVDELFVGNLKPKVVKEIMRKLFGDGYFDFSSMGYQKQAMDIDKTVFDKRESRPYTSDLITCFFYMYMLL